MRRRICVPWPEEVVPSPSAPTVSAKKAGTAWEHWTSQIDDHLKPSTVAKRCTSLKSRKSPALRGFVAGRWALATTSLYPSTKIERPQRARNGAPRRRSSSGIWMVRTAPAPHAAQRCSNIPDRGATSTLAPKPAHGAGTVVTWVSSCSTVPCLSTPGTHGAKWVRATPANAPGCRLRQARCSACPTYRWEITSFCTAWTDLFSVFHCFIIDPRIEGRPAISSAVLPLRPRLPCLCTARSFHG